EAQLFKLMGDSVFTERIFCFLCLLATMLLINCYWSTIIQSEVELRGWGGVPIFLFLVTPVVFWSYRNNMIEMLLTVMVLASSTFMARAIIKRSLFYLFAATIFIF